MECCFNAERSNRKITIPMSKVVKHAETWWNTVTHGELHIFHACKGNKSSRVKMKRYHWLLSGFALKADPLTPTISTRFESKDLGSFHHTLNGPYTLRPALVYLSSWMPCYPIGWSLNGWPVDKLAHAVTLGFCIIFSPCICSKLEMLVL